MTRFDLVARVRTAPLRNLTAIFAAWKTLLFVVALLSPGPGYDTSTLLLFASDGGRGGLTWIDGLAAKFARWDAIYFLSVAKRGYLFEQEWAFGWGLTKTLSGLAKVLPLSNSGFLAPVLAGLVLAHISHLVSVYLLYYIAHRVTAGSSTKSDRDRPVVTAFVTAALHVFSPGGLFLSAPYGESLFSVLNFAGFLLYANSIGDRAQSSIHWRHDAALLGAGLCFGLATTVRSNGLLGGSLFAWDMLTEVLGLWRNGSSMLAQVTSPRWLRRMVFLTLAGLLVALGSFVPQYLAYQVYCTTESARPWCSSIPPSIYTFVQRHYWNVGFLSYWTLSNLPLFILATPMLYLLISTSLTSLAGVPRFYLLCNGRDASGASETKPKPGSNPESKEKEAKENASFVPGNWLRARFALPQLLLAFAALTSFHVQIISRISSGYPLWYVCVAEAIVMAAEKDEAGDEPERGRTRSKPQLEEQAQEQDGKQSEDSTSKEGEVSKGVDGGSGSGLGSFISKRPDWVVKFMIMYALIQGSLFASFLPPA